MSLLPFTSLISADQLTRPVIEQIFQATDGMRAICEAKQRHKLLDDKIVALIFLEPSSRTMLSFQAAAQRLNAGVLHMQGKENNSLAKGESIEDTMRLVSGYADLIVARLAVTGQAPSAAAACSVPFINAGDGANEHPTQSLIDAYTIYREVGTLEGLHIACGFDPRHSRTIHSLVKLLSQYQGNRFTFICPLELVPPPTLLKLLDERGVKYTHSADADELGEADVLYLNRLQEERFADKSLFEQYRKSYVLRAGMVTAKNRLIIDPLPRVDEIATEVDALPQAAYFRQAHNGVPLRMALLSLLLDRQL
jgi:aspartate carbamoyltransferase catalytic subunit